jgi:hypothetical protein
MSAPVYGHGLRGTWTFRPACKCGWQGTQVGPGPYGEVEAHAMKQFEAHKDKARRQREKGLPQAKRAKGEWALDDATIPKSWRIERALRQDLQASYRTRANQHGTIHGANGRLPAGSATSDRAPRMVRGERTPGAGARASEALTTADAGLGTSAGLYALKLADVRQV